VYDTRGRVVSNAPVNFRSRDTTVATVDSAGVVRAVAPGSAWIRAGSYRYYADSALITVQAPPPPRRRTRRRRPPRPRSLLRPPRRRRTPRRRTPRRRTRRRRVRRPPPGRRTSPPGSR
jgi:hypothetical protein